jgi:hypothetical protein
VDLEVDSAQKRGERIRRLRHGVQILSFSQNLAQWDPHHVQITLDIQDEFAAQMIAGDKDISRAALEALALEGYRTERLSESEIRQLPGFETRMEVHAFLKDHGAYMHYSLEDLKHNRESAQRMKEERP